MLPTSDEPISLRASAARLTDLASQLYAMLSGLHREKVGPDYELLLAQFCVHTVRQVKAICILVGNDEEPFYSEQAGQLIRGLSETWSRVAWMMQPDNRDNRMDRARRIYKDSTTHLRKTIDYQSDHVPPATMELGEHVTNRERRILEYERQSGPIKGLPKARQIFEALARPDRYIIFRHESSPVHVSIESLGATTSYLDNHDPILGSPNRTERRAQIILRALDLLIDTAQIIIAGLGLDLKQWQDTVEPVQNELYEGLVPLFKHDDVT